MRELLDLRREMLAFRVLDPACGCGNFLYVAYREMVRLEIVLISKLKRLVSTKEFQKNVGTISLIRPSQFFGLDVDAFAIELAKVTLLFGKKLALDEAMTSLDREQVHLDLNEDPTLPFENLDDSLIRADALFAPWPKANVIIGNPPYQSKNKMQAEFGRAYLNKLHAKYPDVPGRADYCVYWFRRTHDELRHGEHAGLVGTNTIRQNYSRIGGLDYIVRHEGTIIDAVSTQVWSGEAAVHVSIVNWVKGPWPGKKRLSRQLGDNEDTPWETREVDAINSALSFDADVTDVAVLRTNVESGGCYQGQTHGHAGFLIPREEAEDLLAKQPEFAEVLYPYLTADELLGEKDSLPKRYVIDFGHRDLLSSQEFGPLFARVDNMVLAERQSRAEREKNRNEAALADDAGGKTNRDHEQALKRWWQLFRRRNEMLSAISPLSRYIVCGAVTKRPIFEFVSPSIHPNAALIVFPFEDDYSFGILQSDVHWAWFTNRCSTLKGDFRYTSNTVFDTFAWPQSPSLKQIREVARHALHVRRLRRSLMDKHRLSLRELYRAIEKPGEHELANAQAALDEAVHAAYGMPRDADVLTFLVNLNHDCADREAAGDSIQSPGLPRIVSDPKALVSTDSVKLP
jgi:hypothetical protein